ncbi:hypothetical protein PV325_011939 [Microctonus aethiopoides]|nr:hypothetical protein PV325_011939 [Microctonus aethiopoides]
MKMRNPDYASTSGSSIKYVLVNPAKTRESKKNGIRNSRWALPMDMSTVRIEDLTSNLPKDSKQHIAQLQTKIKRRTKKENSDIFGMLGDKTSGRILEVLAVVVGKVDGKVL